MASVSKILENTDVSSWHHVPGQLNPAEELSRGLYATKLQSDHRWFVGPDFLSLSPEHWPAKVKPDELPEVREEWIGHVTVRENKGPVDTLMARSGNLQRLIRFTTWVNRFVDNLRLRLQQRRGCEA